MSRRNHPKKEVEDALKYAEANGWRVISTLQGRCFTTVQVKSRLGGSYALVAVSRGSRVRGSMPAAAALEWLPAGGPNVALKDAWL